MAEPADDTRVKATHCRSGVPLQSHATCLGCRTRIGCERERAPARRAGTAQHLCRTCEVEGAVITVTFDRPYMTATEASRFLGISVVTIRRMVKEGALHAKPMRDGLRPRLWITRGSIDALRQRWGDGPLV